MDLEAAVQARAQAEQALNDAVHSEMSRLVTELRAERMRLGYSQQTIASLIGISRAQIGNAEGFRGLSIEVLIGYAAAVGYRLTLQKMGE